MCGEHGRAHHRRLLLLGSSPHVRGAHSVTYACFPTPGIIPACAGSTCLIRSLRLHRRDHPRMCGEHDVEAGQFKGYVGSSPHVRGARCGGRPIQGLRGIIPACAGSTTIASQLKLELWDHPRMCGEHKDGLIFVDLSSGSSPHVRGAPRNPAKRFRRPGIIPACAGSTVPCQAMRENARDHPRMCGEHGGGSTTYVQQTGSSPHVRGALQPARARHPCAGIIPACAGSTDD